VFFDFQIYKKIITIFNYFHFEKGFRMTNIFSSPDGSQYPFGLAFSPKDVVYSGREVVLKNYRYAPKKN